ncbi:hypothetical protein ABK040_003583 [Willaertia magna]
MTWRRLFQQYEDYQEDLLQKNGGEESGSELASSLGSMDIELSIKRRGDLAERYKIGHMGRRLLSFYLSYRVIIDIISWVICVIGLLAFIVNSIFIIIFVSIVESTKVDRAGTYNVLNTNIKTNYTLAERNVTIEREPNGVIHIKAKTDYDLYFGQGFVSAQERMFQMELNRRIFTGTVSEIAGSAALSIDKFARSMGFKQIVEEEVKMLENDSKSKAILQAFADGVNTYLKTTSRSKLGPEFSLLFGYTPKEWTINDSVGWSKLIAWDLCTNVDDEMKRYSVIRRGVSVNRVEELYPAMRTVDVDEKGNYYYNNVTTILWKEDLNITTTLEQDYEIEKKLFDNSGAYFTTKGTTTNKLKRDKSGKEKEKTWYHSLSAVYEHLSTILGDTNDKLGLKGNERIQEELLSRIFKKDNEASNNWVISGKFTESGKPILSNDPHLTISAPGIWLLFHLNSEESNLDTIGVSFVGVPGMTIGRNKYIAWGLTNSGPDVQDTYVMKIHPSTNVNNNQYYYWMDGKAEAFNVRDEIIKVKGGSDIVYKVFITRFGPIINDVFESQAGKVNWSSDESNIDLPIALRWTALLPNDTTMTGYFKTYQATNWNEFVESLKLVRSVSNNYVFADVNGNIGVYPAGIGNAAPIRKQGHSGMFPVLGNSTQWDYVGYIPHNQVPFVYNPKRGWVVTANNRLAPPGFPLLITNDNAFEYRAKRITQLITELVEKATNQISKRPITPSDIMNVQLDGKSLLFEDFKYIFETIGNRLITKGQQSSSLYNWNERLKKWDGFVLRGSREASLFHLFIEHLLLLPYKETNSIWFNTNYWRKIMKRDSDKACSDQGFSSCIDYAEFALKNAIEYGGGIPGWNSGVHYVAVEHSLLSSTILSCFTNRMIRPSSGGLYTVNVASTRFKLKEGVTEKYIDTVPTLNEFTPLNTVHGVSYRQIVGFVDGSDYFIIPLGQSGNWFDGEYDNLLPLYEEGIYLEMKTRDYVAKRTMYLQ